MVIFIHEIYIKYIFLQWEICTDQEHKRLAVSVRVSQGKVKSNGYITGSLSEAHLQRAFLDLAN